MDTRLLAIAIERETDIILARQRTRQIAEQLGFDSQDQTRITTAVSEIVRNALEYAGGGRVEYRLRREDDVQSLAILVSDKGPGMANADAVLAGTYRSQHGMGVGITGARRLMDAFTIETAPGAGTKIAMVKALPKRAPVADSAVVQKLAKVLASAEGPDPVDEVRRQNRDMVFQLDEGRRRQEELEGLNQELQATNRGVVALYAELAERADHLRHADQLKSRFMSNMTHEFRTPLNSILSLSRLLLDRRDGPLAPEQEKQLHFIRKSAETLTDLVNDLLDLAKVQAGKTVVTRSEFAVGELFATLRGMLRPLLAGDAVDLVFDSSEDGLILYSDEGKISQILRNFISNALKFTEKGEVRVWAERGENAVTFRVRDTGIGIAPENQDLIWQEFSQIDHRLQRRVKGTGLGLPLSKRLATLLGGDVKLESAEGQGSVFTLTLPLGAHDTAHEGSAITVELDPTRKPVLIVEDNAADSFGTERSLAYSRYQPIAVQTIAEAQRALTELTPVAILLDVMLEAEESWRFLIELKQDERYEAIPVVMLSSSDEEGKARGLGADEYLSKPVDAAQLVKVLDELTGASSVIKVLVVDDEEVSRYLVRQLLPRGTFDIAEASTALEGIERGSSYAPDVILFDLNMPDIDGYELLERLGANQHLRSVPAVAVTATILYDEQRVRLSPAAKVLSKFDLTTDMLVSAIREVTGRPVP